MVVGVEVEEAGGGGGGFFGGGRWLLGERSNWRNFERCGGMGLIFASHRQNFAKAQSLDAFFAFLCRILLQDLSQDFRMTPK